MFIGFVSIELKLLTDQCYRSIQVIPKGNHILSVEQKTDKQVRNNKLFSLSNLSISNALYRLILLILSHGNGACFAFELLLE